MSILEVRGAIQAYLNTGIGTPTADAAIPGLNQVYKGVPVFIDPTRWWECGPTLSSGTIVCIHFPKIFGDRIALPAVNGQVFDEYTALLLVLYKYEQPSNTQATQYQGDEWTEGWDTTISALRSYIRKDPNLGTAQATVGTNPPQPGVIYDQFPGVIWQAGQTPGDLEVSGDLPAIDTDNGELIAFTCLEMHVTECLTA